MRFVYILIFTVFLACSQDAMKSYTFGKIEINVPKYMVEKKDKLPDSVAEFIISDPADKSDFKLAIYRDEKSNLNEVNSGLKEYYKFVASDILDNTLESGSLNTPNEEVINGLNSLIFEINGSYLFEDNLYDMFFMSAVYETEDCFYEVTTWVNEESKDEFYNDMQLLIHSFKVLN